MSESTIVVRATGASVLLAVVAACSGPGGGPREDTRSSQAPIIGGSPATAYQEAALIDLYSFGSLVAGCSGSVIAPTVVLTAGHCVTGEPGITPNGWVVKTPYANNQRVPTSKAFVYDWPGNSGMVDPNHHDIGIIILPTPITLSSYPLVSPTELADGTQIVNIGRIDNGTLSNTDLFVASVTAYDGTSSGYPYDYAANDIIQQGDSGGPDEVPGASPHMIVSVNSGAGSDEVLARTDPLYCWIQCVIENNGLGNCSTQYPAGSTSCPTASVDAGGPPPPMDAGGPPPPVDSGGPPVDSGGGGHVDSGSGGGGDSGGGTPICTSDPFGGGAACDSGNGGNPFGGGNPGTTGTTGGTPGGGNSSSGGCSLSSERNSAGGGSLAVAALAVAAALGGRRRKRS